MDKVNNKLLFATKNMGKIKEIREILKDTGYEVLSLNDIKIKSDIVEDGETFEENALIKARTIMKETGVMVLADDSGLEVDYLDKAPGVYSARYMGEDTPQSVKNESIINKLAGIDEEDRTARFVCCVACVWIDGTEQVVRGTIEGIIAHECRGESGFGYDPIFFVPEYDKTMAELTMEEKNKISHRGKALRMMKEILLEK